MTEQKGKPHVHVSRKYENIGVDVHIHQTEVPFGEGAFALSLLEKWGIVAGAPDGEDSQGRAKMTNMPVADVVSRACETAALAFATLRERGWMLQLPTIEEAEKIVDERDAAKPHHEPPQRPRR
jgi:hypothetical protein